MEGFISMSTKIILVIFTSKGRVATKGAHSSDVKGFSVGKKIDLTLSQFSSISIPPHSEKLIVQPSLSETIER